MSSFIFGSDKKEDPNKPKPKLMAFPLHAVVQTNPLDPKSLAQILQGGMELRDYFAAQAMLAIGQDRFIETVAYISKKDENGSLMFDPNGDEIIDKIIPNDDVIHQSATLCYQVADAMIKARGI